MASLARRERAALADLMAQVGPQAPTLAGDWTVADLAAHLVIRESDPVAALGLLVPALARRTPGRMAALLEKEGFEGVLERVRTGPPRFSPFSIPGVDALANSLEFFIHHEDVRRGADRSGTQPRALSREDDDLLWSRLGGLFRLTLRRCPTGVVLERSEGGQAGTGQQLRVRPGVPIVTIIGAPGELVLFGSGRLDAARVQVIGTPQAVEQLRSGISGL